MVEVSHLPVNPVILHLTCYQSDESDLNLENIEIPSGLRKEYHNVFKECTLDIYQLSQYVRRSIGGQGGTQGGEPSRSIQSKLVTLINCQLLEPQARLRAFKTAHQLGERSCIELLLFHQNRHQLSEKLWAAVRKKGCQFLGPGETTKYLSKLDELLHAC